MKIWITRDKGRECCFAWAKKPPCVNGTWEARRTNSATSIERGAAALFLGDQWQLSGLFCFEVEIGEVQRVRTREDVIAGLRNLRINVVMDASITAIDNAIALIENPDSSNRE